MENQTIGIKLADGSFYPILEEGNKTSMVLELTTVRDDQQSVQLDLYRSSDLTMEHAEYVDTLLIENLLPRPREEPSIALKIDIDDDNTLSASIEDKESGESSSLSVSLLNLDETRLSATPDFALTEDQNSGFEFADPSDIEQNTDDEVFGDEAFIEPEEEADAFDDDELITQAADDEVFAEEPPAEQGLDDISFADNSDDTEEIASEVKQEPAFFMSDVSMLEDVPRQAREAGQAESTEETRNDEITEDDEIIQDDEIRETMADTQEPDNQEAVTEEEFPDFQDISVPDTQEQSNDVQEEDTSSMYDFGDEFNDPALDDSIPAPAFSFSDLYEEEDMEKEEKSSNKTLIPVIICIICAVISLTALALMFFGPLSSKNTSSPDARADAAVMSEPVYTEPEPLSEPETVIEPAVTEPVVTEPEEVFAESTVAEPAKENEVVKIESEVVVPEVPAAPKKEENVSYKIKWGDTLWDIADAYYKNPWLYPAIAKFNGIRNPDVIISGTWISIPPK